jgi:uncharacterized protein (DUF3084 family)
MKKSELKIDEAQLEKSLDKLTGVIEKRKAVRGEIDELRKDIHLEIVRDGLVWNPNVSFEDMLQYHREWSRGHGQAQFLATKLPPLAEEEKKLSDEAKSIIKEIAKPCDELHKALAKNLRDVHASNLATIIDRIQPLCVNADEARELAGRFSCVAEIDERLSLQIGFDPEYAIQSARALLREFKRPVRIIGGDGK